MKENKDSTGVFEKMNELERLQNENAQLRDQVIRLRLHYDLRESGINRLHENLALAQALGENPPLDPKSEEYKQFVKDFRDRHPQFWGDSSEESPKKSLINKPPSTMDLLKNRISKGEMSSDDLWKLPNSALATLGQQGRRVIS